MPKLRNLHLFLSIDIIFILWNTKYRDCNEIPIHNHLVHNQTLNQLAKLVGLASGWVFVYEVSDCGFASCCSSLNFRHRVCFQQEVYIQSKRVCNMIRTHW